MAEIDTLSFPGNRVELPCWLMAGDARDLRLDFLHHRPGAVWPLFDPDVLAWPCHERTLPGTEQKPEGSTRRSLPERQAKIEVWVVAWVESDWRGDRVADGAGFENQCAGNRTGGSTPPLSVFLGLRSYGISGGRVEPTPADARTATGGSGRAEGRTKNPQSLICAVRNHFNL